MKQILKIIDAADVNKGKNKGQLSLEHIFGFCKTFLKKRNLGFHLTFKMNDLQNSILTTIATDINVTTNSLYLYVPILIPNSQTQVMFSESIMNNYTFDSWYTERKISNDGRELQVDNVSAQHINGPKYLIGAFQSNNRGTPNKVRKPAVFDTNHVTKYFVEIDGFRYPKDGVLTNFEDNSQLDQYRDLNLFTKEYIGEELLQFYIIYPDMKFSYLFQLTNLRHQFDHIIPNKIHLFQEFSEDPAN